jgi:hypothetical protein
MLRLRSLAARLAVVALATFAISCNTLEAPQRDVCGNLVVEPGNGEYCDEAQPGSRCGAPDSVGACQPLCDAGDPARPCPARYQCGVDGVCREPSLDFSSPGVVAGDGAVRQLIGDEFDGDGRDDLVSVSSEVQLRTFDPTLATVTTYRNTSLQQESTDYVTVGELTSSGLADLVAPVEVGYWTSLGAYRGVQALLSQGDGTLRSAFVPHRVGVPEDARFLIETAFASLVLYADELALWKSLSSPQFDVIRALPREAALLAQPVATFVEAGCLVVAFAYRDEDVVHLESFDVFPDEPCGVPAGSKTIQVPGSGDAAVQVAGVWSGDVDGDGLTDLLVAADPPNAPEALHANVYPAFGRGDRTFASAETSDPTAVVGEASSLAIWPTPLATGDLDGDGIVDAVYESAHLIGGRRLAGLFSGTPATGFNILCEPFATWGCIQLAATNVTLEGPQAPQWSQAVIGDVDADGHADLVVSERLRPAVLVFAGTGDSAMPLDLLPRVLQTAAPSERFALANLDRVDSLTDIVLAVPNGDEIAWSVARGQPFAQPLAPATQQRFSRIGDVCPGAPLVLAAPEEDDPMMAARYEGEWPPIITAGGNAPAGGKLTPFAGRFLGDPLDSVAILDLDFSIGLGVQLLQNKGEALLGRRATPLLYPRASLPGCDAGQCQSSAVAVWDLEGDGIDELVVLSPGLEEDTGLLSIARGATSLNADDESVSELIFDEPIDVGFPLGTTRVFERGRVVTIDPTGTGAKTALLALTTDPEAPELLRFEAGALDAPTVLATFDADRAPLMLATMPMGLGEPEVIVLLLADGTVEFHRILTDASESPTHCPAPPGAEVGDLIRCKDDLSIEGATTLATGDFDGDGVQDLALATESRVTLHHGWHYREPLGSEVRTAEP